ncbi:MAG: NTP transferase domain-containing protein [Acidimicrobiia bacterium]|nr:NTP transferase domain-containing protein [Acidimicrobiia bacterium]MBT8213748.1 NTP transferase domain-containing protein [Acidimicrobiia bacterium]NNK90827.1 NTP transferase domain-containing protein [Acidimicrobiia bacterium]
MSTVGLIVAGGDSTRMGRDKASVEIAGRTFVSWVADALSVVADRIVVAGRSATVDGFETIPDPDFSVRGPLAGLAALAGTAPTERVTLVVAIDQPFVRAETLALLQAHCDDLPVVPVDDGTRQVTCMAYPSGLLHAASEEAGAGGSLQTLLERVGCVEVTEQMWAEWGEDGRSWRSLDTPDDVAHAIEVYGV